MSGASGEPDALAQVLDFFLELDRLKSVERRNFLADGSRRENTAEHSWHLGMAALVLAPFAEEPVDVGRAVAMALAHDIVEIDAGDTFAYDQGEGAASKAAREVAAADRLFGILPPQLGRHLRDLWDEYERGDTAEARFVMAVDRMAPMLLNLAEGGTTWREHGITPDRVEARNRPHIEPVLPGVWAEAARRLAAASSGSDVSDDRTSSPSRHRSADPASPVVGTVPRVIDLLEHPRRLVALEAAHNFRDLGGYPTDDGAVTRWGRLFRADGLHRLTDADVEIVRSLGLRTVIDLRTQAELDERGRAPAERFEAAFTHLPVIDATWSHDASDVHESDHDFLVWAYSTMIDEGASRFARAIEELARPGALPAVFHCAAGKDRTGILAALVLGSLGVPRDLVLGDYGLTAAGMARMRVWAAKEFPEMADRMLDAPSAFLAALPDALGEVLDRVVGTGSVRDYVRSIGVSAASLDVLAAELLEPPTLRS
jgi:5'-deoxynucleotidase YfbR-like HD superfamily hydrolase